MSWNNYYFLLSSALYYLLLKNIYIMIIMSYILTNTGFDIHTKAQAFLLLNKTHSCSWRIHTNTWDHSVGNHVTSSQRWRTAMLMKDVKRVAVLQLDERKIKKQNSKWLCVFVLTPRPCCSGGQARLVSGFCFGKVPSARRAEGNEFRPCVSLEADRRSRITKQND